VAEVKRLCSEVATSGGAEARTERASSASGQWNWISRAQNSHLELACICVVLWGCVFCCLIAFCIIVAMRAKISRILVAMGDTTLGME